jgi:molybdopterin molybdotransferase
MISTQEAHALIAREVAQGPVESVALSAAHQRILAEDLLAPMTLPPFASSAMDGYAVRIEDTQHATVDTPVQLAIAETICAGMPPTRTLSAGEAAHIMTGAMIPQGATAVVPQENVEVLETNHIRVVRPVRAQAHIRQAGEEIVAGARALAQGTVMTPGALGFLGSLGINTVPIVAPPRVTVVPTGNELCTPGEALAEGAIYESNSVALRAALAEFAITPNTYPPIADDEAILYEALRTALDESDIVIVTGGASVGAYDFVKSALQRLDVTRLFWGVAQKPGKPIFFGRRTQTFVFGLPGNPASSLVCYFLYVRQALCQWLGWPRPDLPEAEATLGVELSKKRGRTHYLRAVATWEEGTLRARPADHQGSHCMQAFAKANALMVLPSARETLLAGERVTIQWLPHAHALQGGIHGH